MDGQGVKGGGAGSDDESTPSGSDVPLWRETALTVGPRILAVSVPNVSFSWLLFCAASCEVSVAPLPEALFEKPEMPKLLLFPVLALAKFAWHQISIDPHLHGSRTVEKDGTF